MRFGIVLPHSGTKASKAALVDVAQLTEDLGFDSLWVFDRLLYPLEPKTPYPGSQDGRLPEPMQIVFEPLTTLAFVAAHTGQVQLGTGVLVLPFRPPVVAARMIATLDVLSEGRLILGVGAGWSSDEYEASGMRMENRGARLDEYLRLLKTLWSEDEPSFQGRFYTVPRNHFEPRPVQKPHPPIWIGGDSLPAVRRAAELGDGWYPSGYMSPDLLAERIKLLHQLAEERGRNPQELTVGTWVPLLFTDEEHSGHYPFIGTSEKIIENLRLYQRIGVGHIAFELSFAYPTMKAMIEAIERFANEVMPVFED